MLKIDIPEQERFDKSIGERGEFVYSKALTLVLEHSLISISKWEEKWHKPFLSKQKKSAEEILDYIRCMVVQPQNVTIDDIRLISKEDLSKINDYISDPATATKIDKKVTALMNRGLPKTNAEMTSELIYYYMAEFRLPADYQKWRLPRLLTLIETCQVKEWEKDPKHKKMLNHNLSMRETAKSYHDLNQKRRAMLKSNG